MIVLTPIATVQSISVAVRAHDGIQYLVMIVDENKNTTTSTVTEGAYTDGILTINVIYNFQEGKYYNVKIFSLYGGTEYDEYILRMQQAGATVEATSCLSYAIVELMAFAAEALLCFHRIYITAQTNYSKYTVLDGYYTEITKTETTYIEKPTI